MSSDLTRMVSSQAERIGIVRELYAVSAEYTATLQRLRQEGRSEDEISDDFYLASIRAYLSPLQHVGTDHGIAKEDMQMFCINLATIALRYARKMRLSS